MGKFFLDAFSRLPIFWGRRVESLRISSLFGEADSVSLNVESLSRDLSSCFDFLPGRGPVLHARCTDTPIDRQSLMNESQSEYRSLEWKLGFVASTLPDLSGNPQLRLVDSIVFPCRNVHKYPRRFESQALQSRICERSPAENLPLYSTL